MSRHNMHRLVDLAQLADELSERIGRPVDLSSARSAPDDPEGVLVPIDPETGDELDVDDEAVQQVLGEHEIPEPEPDPLDVLEQALSRANSVSALRAALTDYVAGEKRVRRVRDRGGRITPPVGGTP